MKALFLKTAQKGFTLIELMVVVAIIGILAAMAMSAYTGATAKARNARLKGNVKAYQAAMEQTYNGTTGVYAGVSATNFSTGSLPAETTLSIPAAPATLTKYCIYSDVLNTTAEGGADKAGANCTGASGGDCTWNNTASATRYCVSNIQ